MQETPTDIPKKKRGRPRKSEEDTTLREEIILSNALDLFQSQGFQKTSMTQIAHAAGMDQSSLYYHFDSKEALVNRLYNFDHVKDRFARLDKADIDSALKLYLLIVYDLISKCDLPFDFFEFEFVATDKPGALPGLFDAYRVFYHCLINTISQGVESKLFFECDPHMQAVNILSVNEGLQHHYHAKGRGQLILETAGYTAKNLSPEEIGEGSARLVLSKMCVERPDFNDLKARGHEVALAEELMRKASYFSSRS
ncbi:MAG: TetR family transcriptional regulator [Coriobacteriia bacterium]|nr:TetR family transcriptional regulator [Coriobacteriia bacterium]